MSKAFIGSSGWTYDGWRGRFYLETLAQERLARLVRQPVPEHRDQRFVLPHPVARCASKFITYWKRLGEACPSSIELMETRLQALSPKVGAVLFQLPPQFSKN